MLDRLVPQVVNGQTTMVKVRDVIVSAQKVSGADAKFRDASDKENTLRHKTDSYDALASGFQNSDAGAVRRGLTGLGLSSEVVETMLNPTQPTTPASPATPQTPAEGEEEDPDKARLYEALETTHDQVVALQAQVEKLTGAETTRRTNTGKEILRNQILEALDNDPELGKIVGSLPDEAKLVAQSEAIRRVLAEQQGSPGPFGPHVIRAGLAKAKPFLDALEPLTTQGKDLKDEASIFGDEDDPPILGLGPSQSLGPVVTPDPGKDYSELSMLDDSFDVDFQGLIAQGMREASKKDD